jgi:hypothetical protein
MWMRPGPGCLDYPFSTELGNTEINNRIRGVLAPRADPNLGTGLPPLTERVNSLWVSLLCLAFSYLCQSPFLNVGMLLCRVSGVLIAPCGVSPYLRMW